MTISADDFLKDVEEPASPKKMSADKFLSDIQDKSPSQSIYKKAWDALKIPEQKSREGLNELANMMPTAEPTGNTIRDGALNARSILGHTVADVAPGFISRGALVTGGALKVAGEAARLIDKLGSVIGEGAEKLSGLGYKTPGVLAEAVKDPSLILGKGVEAARKAYQGPVKDTFYNLYGVLTKGNGIREELQAPLSSEDFITKALDFAKTGDLTPEEALEARKALDTVKRKLTNVGYYKTRQVFDQLAKQGFEGADAAYSRAIKSEALRTILPMNKTGTPSIAKMVLGGLKTLTVPALSPMAQGFAASGIGIAKKILEPFINDPRIGVAVQQALAKYMNGNSN